PREQATSIIHGDDGGGDVIDQWLHRSESSFLPSTMSSKKSSSWQTRPSVPVRSTSSHALSSSTLSLTPPSSHCLRGPAATE
uniref:Uncharacterized protein n=1 Tax=Oryza brachyantha TaxID=4533 RepID=J3L6B5_ORYBR